LLVDFNIAKKSKRSSTEFEESKSSKFTSLYLSHIATPNSQAPELLKEGYYTESIDLWGVGLVLYTLLTGYKLKREAEVVSE